MHTNTKRVVAAAVIAACSAVGVGGLAGSAGARVAAKNTKFCEALRSGADIEADLSPDSAEFAIKQIGKLLKTNPPSKVKKALKAIRKAYQRLADGEPASEVLIGASSSFATYSKYVVSNCRS